LIKHIKIKIKIRFYKIRELGVRITWKKLVNRIESGGRGGNRKKRQTVL
jgi:hypothetical protein